MTNAPDHDATTRAHDPLMPEDDEPRADQERARWSEFYDLRFASSVLQGRSESDLDDATCLLWRALRLEAGSRVFDQGAGVGAIAVRLADRGCHVSAIERETVYIEQLEQQRVSPRSEGSLNVLAGDASELVLRQDYDAGYSWHTSFGHFERDEQNLALLQRACDALRPGGRFVLDYYAAPALLRDFSSSSTTRVGSNSCAMTLTRESKLDLRRGLLHQTWRRAHADGSVDVRRGSTRIYMPHELCALHERAGLNVLELLGNWHGDVFTLDSPRCIVVSARLCADYLLGQESALTGSARAEEPCE